jgi:excisionase family DNA binding protein
VSPEFWVCAYAITDLAPYTEIKEDHTLTKTTNILANSELFSRERAAEYLGVKSQTLALWASTGRYALPFVKVGRCVRYKKSDLDAWLLRRTCNAAAVAD